MRFTRRSFLGAALAVPFAAAATAQERSIVDDAGRRVALPSRALRVYAAGPPASQIVFALSPDRLLGWTTHWRDHERFFVAPRYADLPMLGRLTGRGNTANVETVLAARPDLIFDYGSVNATFASLADRVQQQTGIPYLLLDGSFEAMPASIEKLGIALDEPARAADLAGWVRAQLALVDDGLTKIPPARRPRVYYGRGPRGLDTGLGGSINTEIIERAGAVNVAASLGRGGLVQVSLEQVLAWAPDVIVTIDPTFFASLRGDRLWRGVPAVQNGRVYLAPNAPFGWVDFPPGLNRLLGLRWLCVLLYPTEFPGDLRGFVADAYTRLYHQRPSDAQLDALLISMKGLAP
jgi:iron complex transport system substrate-binding protein